MREFTDSRGVEWQVFLMTRGTHAVSREQHLPEPYREGWLVFQSASEKRRFAPPPADWDTLSDEQLEGLLARAAPHTIRGHADAPEQRSTPAAEEPLRPQLVAVERQLDESLGEVCEMPASGKLDTGELIRVEETLAIAANAAKEAVSLRRKLRADQERKKPEQGGGSHEIHG